MYDYVTSSGIIVADTSDLQAEVEQEYKDTFGQDLVVTDNTPQGVLIVSETAERANAMRNNAALANQINPNIAGGIFLDAIWALTGGFRAGATFSTALVNMTGVAGTIVPEGTIIENGTEDQFQSISEVTLDGSGTASVTFQSLVSGPIAAPAGSLTNIVSGPLGLETVTNPDAAILGSLVESDAAARTLRKTTLALQGSMISEAIISAVNALTRKSMSFIENVQDDQETINGVNMSPHSIYCCVDGATDQEVAEAIYSKKSAGCNYTNGQSSDPKNITVTDPYSGQTSVVKFDRPDLKVVSVQIQISAKTASVNAAAIIKQTVLDYSNGEIDGEPGFAVGSNISPFEIAGAINIQEPSVFVKSVKIAFDAGTPIAEELTVEKWEKGYTTLDNIGVSLV